MSAGDEEEAAEGFHAYLALDDSHLLPPPLLLCLEEGREEGREILKSCHLFWLQAVVGYSEYDT